MFLTEENTHQLKPQPHRKGKKSFVLLQFVVRELTKKKKKMPSFSSFVCKNAHTFRVFVPTLLHGKRIDTYELNELQMLFIISIAVNGRTSCLNHTQRYGARVHVCVCFFSRFVFFFFSNSMENLVQLKQVTRTMEIAIQSREEKKKTQFNMNAKELF